MPGPSIGTANVIQLYQPPVISRVSAERAKQVLAKKPKRIDAGMWHILTWKLHGGPARGYQTTVLMKDKDGWYLMGVPTDKAGKIPLTVVAARLMDVSEGDRDGRERNVMVDLAINAKSMGPFDNKPFSYRWYLHPNEHDIISIDDVNSKIVTIMEQTKKGTRRSLIITGGTQAQQESVAKAVKDNFTVREKRVLAGTLIQIKKCPRGVAGYFQGHTDAEGNPMGVPIIGIDPAYAMDSQVVVHEVIHDLRQFDQRRPPKMRAVKHYRGRDADLEESLTEAETVARQKPLTKHTSRAGYYRHINIPGKDIGDMVIEDRITITEPKDPKLFVESGKKGVRAQKKVLKHYPETNISHMKLHGPAEAIDTYYKLENQGVQAPKQQVHVQLYSPGGGKAQDKRLDKRMKKHTRMKASQWEDGRLVNLRKPNSRPARPGVRPGFGYREGQMFVGVEKASGAKMMSRHPIKGYNKRPAGSGYRRRRR